MSDYPNERDCEHGHLRRQCPICELEAENKALRSRLQESQIALAAAEGVQVELDAATTLLATIGKTMNDPLLSQRQRIMIAEDIRQLLEGK